MARILVGYTVLVTLVLVGILFIGGVFTRPLGAYRAISRKKVYPSSSVFSDVDGLDHGPARVTQWNIRFPHVTHYVFVTGGLGNTLLALAIAAQACIDHGIHPPVLVFEEGGEFDFHRMPDGGKFAGLRMKNITDIIPWVSALSVRSCFAFGANLSGAVVWRARSGEPLPPTTSRSVVQLTDYEKTMGVGDEAFRFLRESISGCVYEYIRKHYLDGNTSTKTMAVHLRLGQATDDFIPPSPTRQEIEEHYTRHHGNDPGTKILVFTDNLERSREVMEGVNIPGVVEWVGDCAPVECLLIGMCSSAIISHSTFSVVGCRISGLTQVTLVHASPNCHFKEMFCPEWTLIPRARGYKG